jgi:hypothetical protein
MLGQQQMTGDVIRPANADAGKSGELEGVKGTGLDGEGLD